MLKKLHMTDKALFLDRDGTLIQEKHYLHRIEDVTIETDVIPALQKFIAAGYKLIIITNQSGIGRGYFTEADFQNVQEHLIQELEKHAITITQTYHCPHVPEDLCACRKPSPNMLLNAMKDHNLSPENCTMIGDNITDVQAGQNAGCKTVLVTTGHGKKMPQTNADRTIHSLLELEP